MAKNEIMLNVESEIQFDPTLRFILREAKLEYSKMNSQIDIQIAAFKIALSRSIDSEIKKIKYNDYYNEAKERFYSTLKKLNN